MANKHANLDSLFNDIADAIREKIGDESIIPAVEFPDLIRDRLQVIKKPYLTFKSPNSFTLKVNDTTKHWNGTLEYSTDASTWTAWDGTTSLSSATKGRSNVLYMRGTGNTVITGSTTTNYRWVLTGSNISCIGNIENLLDYATVAAGNYPNMASSCYYGMFRECTSLTQAPSLPATTLATNCYFSMFSGCTSLTQAPDLPATTLESNCYRSMFSGCTSLTKAPALPATTLANYCYYQMFQNCTGFTQAPTLPATTLANSCYLNMFYGCTSLTQAPVLSATTLVDGCYRSMFQGCTSLTQAPSLPATTLADSCYSKMFQGCTALTQAPALPATTLAPYCYKSMFQGCTGLTQAPALPATTLAAYCYELMFRDCTSLTQAPELPATMLTKYCYADMFRGCASLTQAPEFPATTLESYCYSNIFRDCTSLTRASALPATTLANNCYYSMFWGCTSLTQAPALPATTLADSCYQYMFSDCASLTQTPDLPATTLAGSCYANMFQRCSKIKLSSTQTGEYTVTYRIPSFGTGTTATDALTNMFTDTGGTFTGTPEINTIYYLSNTNEVIGGPIVVDITASNISDYFTVTNGSSYYFKGEGNVFTTNNAGVNRSTATTTLTAKQDISEISFNYSYSSEPNYDKFTLKVAGSTIENAVSGATTTKSYNGSLTSGQTIEFKYVKDGSVNKNNDKCTFSNMVIKLG